MDYLENEQLVQYIPQLSAHLTRDIVDLTIYNEKNGNISEIVLGIHWSQEWISYIISYNNKFYLPDISEALVDNLTLEKLMQIMSIHQSAYIIHDMNFIEGYEVDNLIHPLKYCLSDIKNAKIDICSDNFPFNVEGLEVERELEQENGYVGIQQTG